MKINSILPKNNYNEDIDQEDVDIRHKSFHAKIFTTVHSYQTHTVYLSDWIDPSKDYTDLCNILRTAHLPDRFKFYINNDGGSLNRTFQILNSMRDCESPITTVLDGDIASAATFVFLIGDSYEIKEFASMTCHNYSSSAYGKANELSTQISFFTDYMKKFFEKIYSGFLTEEEINNLNNGRDYIFGPEEIETRLKRYVKENELKKRIMKEKGFEFPVEFEEDEVEEEVKPKVKHKRKKIEN